MAQERRSERVLASFAAGMVIGAVEVVLAVSFAALVYGGYLAQFLADGIGLYLLAAAITMAILAWAAGPRGVVGSVQDAAAAVLAVVATSSALDTFGSLDRAFLTVVGVTMVVTFLTGVAFLVLGTFRLGNLVRFVPYPVVGGFLAGTGWLLAKGGVGVAARLVPSIGTFGELMRSFELVRWVPAVAFGVLLLLATRLVKRPLVIPAVLALGFAAFVVGMLVTGSSLDAAREGGWLVGPFDTDRLLQPWTLRAVSGADWSAVLDQAGGIVTAIFVAIVAALFNVSGIELTLHTDLDSNREIRDVGFVNVASSAFGGIPGYHALSLTSLAHRMGVGARPAGLLAALVPLTAVVVGGSVVQLIPRMIVGGVLVFVGLSFLTEWVVDVRRSLPLGEYLIVIAILVTIATRGFLPGIVVGLVLAVALFAVNYSRIELVRDVPFGTAYRSNIDRPPGELALLQGSGDRVQVLRVNGFVFFGTASGLLERIRRRVEAGGLQFLLVDLQRATGMDSSAVLSFRKAAQLAHANRFEIVFAGASERVRAQLRRGGVLESEGMVRFERDLDHGLQWCEDRLLETVGEATPGRSAEATAGPPAGLEAYLERRSVPAGTRLLRQGDPPDDVLVLESGQLVIELVTSDGVRLRLRTVRPGVVAGEIGLYTGEPRTADVTAETPSVVSRLSRGSLERMEAEDPALAAAVHRWLATTLADRLGDMSRRFDALFE